MTQKPSLSIALVQMTTVDSLDANLLKFESIFNSIKKLQEQTNSERPLDLICFPENCLFMRVKTTDPIKGFEFSHACFTWLGEWAKRLKSCIHLGSVPLLIDGKLYNSSVWFSEDGVVQLGYQKVHLFDIALEGKTPIRESDVFERGKEPRIHIFKGWRIGESICYDIRFSELYSKYAYENVDVILVPSAFLEETGKAHWEILLRARAIESQCFVVASAQVGSHRSTQYPELERRTYGKSMIIDPWGSVELNLGESEGVQIHHLHKDRISKVRTQIPMANHRRMHRRS